MRDQDRPTGGGRVAACPTGPDLAEATLAPLARPAGVEHDRAGLEILDRHECLRLLSLSDRGRIAVTVGALPVILPVRFVLDVGRVVLCVGKDTVLERATDDNVVSLQADGVDPDSQSEWSVSVIGIARHLSEPDELAASARLPLPRWSLQLPPRYVAISADQVSGRRTQPDPLPGGHPVAPATRNDG